MELYLMIFNNLLHFIKHQSLARSLRLANLVAEALLVDGNLIGLDACKYTNSLTRETYIETTKKMVVHLREHLR